MSQANNLPTGFNQLIIFLKSKIQITKMLNLEQFKKK